MYDQETVELLEKLHASVQNTVCKRYMIDYMDDVWTITIKTDFTGSDGWIQVHDYSYKEAIKLALARFVTERM